MTEVSRRLHFPPKCKLHIEHNAQVLVQALLVCGAKMDSLDSRLVASEDPAAVLKLLWAAAVCAFLRYERYSLRDRLLSRMLLPHPVLYSPSPS